MTVEKSVDIVAQRVYENTKKIRQDEQQRRNQVVDLYGVEYTRQGDSGNPARFYISISPDMVYLERFQFKLIIQPFVSYSDGMSSVELTTNNRSLTVQSASGSGSHTHDISPNPHNHTIDAHTHTLVKGISTSAVTASSFFIYVEGIDVTPYLMAQYDLPDGRGIFPSSKIGEDYDILQVACDMQVEGFTKDAEILLQPGYKEVTIKGDAPFQVTLVNYLKYSHLNR